MRWTFPPLRSKYFKNLPQTNELIRYLYATDQIVMIWFVILVVDVVQLLMSLQRHSTRLESTFAEKSIERIKSDS